MKNENEQIRRGVVFYAMIVGKLPFQTPKRGNETHDENRNRLVAELKHGLGPKQLNELIKCNNCEFLLLLSFLGWGRSRVECGNCRGGPWFGLRARCACRERVRNRLTSYVERIVSVV